MMHGRGKSDFAIVAVKPATRWSNPLRIRGSQGGDQGECGPAKHVPNPEPGKRVTGAETDTANLCRYDPR
jgi:hypothetical protein